jgi:DNA-binding MurR/RpiR family transcriptional regulator
MFIRSDLMNIFSKFEHLKDLTQNETVFVDFIKNNPEQFINMKSSEICNACYISSSSIYRLCNKLGLSGLSELKVQVSASLVNYVSENKEFENDFSCETPIAKTISENILCLPLYAHLSNEDVNTICDIILNN